VRARDAVKRALEVEEREERELTGVAGELVIGRVAGVVEEGGEDASKD
jgi:hypothetical protein